MAPTKTEPKRIGRPRSHYQQTYATVQRALSAEYKKHFKGYIPWEDFLRSHHAKRVRASTTAESHQFYDATLGSDDGENRSDRGSIRAAADDSTSSKRARTTSPSSGSVSPSDPNHSDNSVPTPSMEADVEMENEPGMESTVRDGQSTGTPGGASRRGGATGIPVIRLGLSSGDQTWTSPFQNPVSCTRMRMLKASIFWMTIK